MGGAGRAAVRSVRALKSIGIDAMLISREEALNMAVKENKFDKFIISSFSSALTFGQKTLVQNSDELITSFSFDILQSARGLKEIVKDFDVVHLHAAYNFFRSSKIMEWLHDVPLAITLHDQRLLTGGCHYSTDCLGLFSNCSTCPKVRKFARKSVKNRKSQIRSAILNSNKKRLHLIAPSQWMKNVIESTPECREVLSSVVYNCVPDSFFRKSNLGHGKAKIPKVGIVANDVLSPYKGFDFFLKGVSYFSKNHGVSVDIVVVTKHAKKMNQNDIAVRVISPKSDTDYLEILDELTVVCVPSLIDNSPNVIIEALARRIMVLASNAGGTGEIPDHMGISTFEYGNLEDFSDKLAAALAGNQTSEEQNLLLSNFVSETAHASKLKEIYDSMI